MALRTAQAKSLLRGVLRDVSRSFYLTVRVLPSSIRDQIGLAYLLARTSDTIADTDALSPARRLDALNRFRRAVLEGGPMPDLRDCGPHATPSEQILLGRAGELPTLLRSYPEADQQLIRQVLDTIVSGQRLDLSRFGAAGPGEILSLRGADELDDYTYRVAGCVGEFWTRICVLHLRPTPRMAPEELVGEGIRFGKGLQLVNILRDLPKDLRLGRCYLPGNELVETGLKAEDLLNPASHGRLQPVYERWRAVAAEHMQVGWQYTLHLPRSWLRVRLACAWPILIGFQTLERLGEENVLDATRRVKISRAEVKKLMRASVLALPFWPVWKRLPERLSRAAKKVNQVAR